MDSLVSKLIQLQELQTKEKNQVCNVLRNYIKVNMRPLNVHIGTHMHMHTSHRGGEV